MPSLYRAALDDAAVDMTAFPVGPGDLLFVTAGPGELSTAAALIGVAKAAGAATLVVTAQPSGSTSRLADATLLNLE